MLFFVKKLLFVILFLFVSNILYGIQRFIPSGDKMSNWSSVSAIFQDKQGYVWVSTDYGLNRISGSDIQFFLHSQEDSYSLPDNYTGPLFQDSFGNIWVSTVVGLYKFDINTEFFLSYKFEKEIFNRIFYNGILEDNNGRLWLSSSLGLVKIDLKTEKVSFYDNVALKGVIPNRICLLDNKIWIGGTDGILASFNVDTEDINIFHLEYPNLMNKAITAICKGNNGNLWLAVYDGGLISFNVSSNVMNLFHEEKNNTVTEIINCLLSDVHGNIWVGTDGKGIWKLDQNSLSLLPYKVAPLGFNPYLRKVSCLYEDGDGNIWASYVEKGILIIHPQEHGFDIIQNDIFSNSMNISDYSIISIMVDEYNNLWIGTNGGGGYVLEGDMNGSYKVSCRFLPHENVFTSIYQFTEKKYFLGTYLHGFYIYDKSNNTYERFYNDGKDIGLMNNHVLDFAENIDGTIWVATNGGGISLFDPVSKRFIENFHTKSPVEKALTNDYCNVLLIDKEFLWIGTTNGVNCINISKRQVVQLPSCLEQLKMNILDMALDAHDNIWFGTKEGLACYNKKQNSLHIYYDKDGLPDSFVTNIQNVGDDIMWVGTNNGLAYYDRDQDCFVGYGYYDGINNSLFKPRSSVHNRYGKLFFGGNKGITVFDSRFFDNNRRIKNLVFTDLYISGNKIEIGEIYDGDTILYNCLNETKHLVLSHNHCNISIGFDAMMFVSTEMVKYEYKLVGFDDNWQKPQMGNREVAYTNLPPGDYILRIKAYLPDNSKGVEKYIKITILTPWWNSWWAKLLYLGIILYILFFSYRLIKQQLKEKQRRIEQKFKEAVAKSELNLFAEISQDIRTTLTLVISPLKQLMRNETNDSVSNLYQIMYRNALRILHLDNQLLDMKKIESNQISLHIQEIELVPFVNDIIEAFSPLSSEKRIQVLFSHEDLPDIIWGDPDCLDKIMYNILSNALKFTPNGGYIDIVANISKEDKLHLSVIDSGIGIPDRIKEKIFNRFYQANNCISLDLKGSGIGLNITKKLIELNHGTIKVYSEEHIGTEFSILLPYHKEDFKSDELASHSLFSNERKYTDVLGVTHSENIEYNRYLYDNVKDKKILILQKENIDKTILLKEFEKKNILFTVTNGKIGYEVTVKDIPDIIIINVMKPFTDELEMIKRIRKNPSVRHIPIILLTAKNLMEECINGISHGADMYISKPFEIKLLYVSIINLLNKQTLFGFNRTNIIETGGLVVKTADDKFLERLNGLIKDRISDPTFNVESLSSEFGISRIHLHRKLRDLCKKTPTAYLRSVRLEHAAYLLRNKNMTVVDVAYAVGFNSPQYFASCFKEYYMVSPKEYAQISENAVRVDSLK